MDYTIGEYAKELIENIINVLEDKEADPIPFLKSFYSEVDDIYESFKILIEQIGETEYSYGLLKCLKESEKIKREQKLKYLEVEKMKLEEEIEALKKGLS